MASGPPTPCRLPMIFHPSTHPDRRVSVFAQLIAVCLIIVGCKFWLIASDSSPLPFLDQWKGEGAEVLRPWINGTLRITDLFAPFNEHRMVPTRLLALGLFEANAHQWDGQVEMVVGAMLHATCAFILGLILLRRLGDGNRLPIFAILLVLFSLPFGWQNTVGGFQSQFYFLILFTLATLCGLGWNAAGTWHWWGGVAAGLIACITFGSGGFAGLALAGWLGLKLLTDSAAWRQRANWITPGIALTLGLLGFALYTPTQNEAIIALHSRSPGHFLYGLGIRLAWPNTVSPFLALPAFAPFAALLWVRLREIRSDGLAKLGHQLDDLLFPLGFWVILQTAAVAWARNGPAASVVSRYMDLLALGCLVNFCCLLQLAALAAGTSALRWKRRAVIMCAIVWSGLTLAGLTQLIDRNIRVDLPGLRQVQRAQILAIRKFLISDQIADLGGKRTFGLSPADLELLAGLLRDPVIQDILPTGIGVRRAVVPTGPLSAASRALADAWALVLATGGLVWILASASRFSMRRRSLCSREERTHSLSRDGKADDSSSERTGIRPCGAR